MIKHEVHDPALNMAVVTAAFGNTRSPSAKLTSSPESELHLTLAQNVATRRGGEFVYTMFSDCYMRNHMCLKLNES